MANVTNPDRRDVIRSVVYIFIYITGIGTSAVLLLPEFWYVWFILVIVGMWILVNWHKEKTAYRCPACEHIYKISFFTDLTAPHGFNRDGGWLMLRCPNCKKWNKTTTLKSIE